MTQSLTRTSSFTITDARYVGAKIGADLRQLRALYGKPEDSGAIANYVEEVAQLLKQGYLGSVSYGFRDPDTNSWKLRLRYRATLGGQLIDSKPGQLPRAADVSGFSFYSFLDYAAKFHDLSPDKQAAFTGALPIIRTTGTEPSTGAGSTTPGHGYGRNGSGVTREVFVALVH